MGKKKRLTIATQTRLVRLAGKIQSFRYASIDFNVKEINKL